MDWIELVRKWVEEDTAPDRVIISKMEDDQVVVTRTVFPYPSKAVYDGTGDPSVEVSFSRTEGGQ